METTLLIVVLVLAVIYILMLQDSRSAAARLTMQEMQALSRMTESLEKYRLITIEQVQGLWLIYNSVSGSFVGQSNTREGVVDVVRGFWPDKIVLAMDRAQDEVFLVHAPPGAQVDPNEVPLVVDIPDR